MRASADIESATPPEKKKKRAADADSLSGDYGALALLLLLYTLQGIPMGLSGSLPLLMQERKVSTMAQATFSTIAYPFAFKLLWAPLVDAVYSSAFGRRKTWIVPVQMTIGLLLIGAGPRIEGMLGPVPSAAPSGGLLQNVASLVGKGGGASAEGGTTDVRGLTALFFVFYFLAATQDIAVDGLALTILSPKNKELGATCNAVGQTLGYFFAYVGFLGLNAYGLVSLGGFMVFWGWVFVGSTLWVLTVRRDEHTRQPGGNAASFFAAYREMALVLKLPSVLSLMLVLLTCKAPLAAFDSLIGFELLACGVSKELLASLATVMLPVGMAAQGYVSKRFAAGEAKPMHVWLASYRWRLALGLSFVGFVFALRAATAGGAPVPVPFMVGGLVLMVLSSVLSSSMFVAQMAFYNSVSDPRIGGTYMTMLNTLSNLGGQWPGTFVLAAKGVFEGYPSIDAFSVVCGSSALLGLIWVRTMSARVNRLQALPVREWRAKGVL